MVKKSGTIDQAQTQNKSKQVSREEINAALARLQKIAENLPPMDAAKIVREGRDMGSNRNR
jgi:hypothetical protein